MNLPMMVDCRSLVDFCRSFHHHRNSLTPSSSPRKQRHRHLSDSWNPLCHHHSPFPAVDIIVLFFSLAALSFLFLPYLSFLLRAASSALSLLHHAALHPPFAYTVGLVAMFVAVVVLWEILSHQALKCGNPYCRGLRKAVEFDIQLESEECVKYMPRLPKDVYGGRPLELGQDHKELEAELKRMAPLNGRTVLIFRAACGCPAGRMEVWGPKKPGRIKK